MHPASIAIVGAGFSGSTLALQLLAAAQRLPLKIYLIDKSGTFGPGQAYSTAFPGHLMNVRAAKLAVTPDNANDFVTWLAERQRQDAPDARFAERSAYGDYLTVHVRRASHTCEPGALEYVRDAAIAVQPKKDGVEIQLATGRTLDVAAAVLALGNQPALPPAPLAHLADTLIDPWSADFARIRPDENVLLLGAGLTMVDVMLRLTATPRTGKVLALSRRGLLPRPHVDVETKSEACFQVDGRLSEMLKQFRAEIQAATARGEAWQTVFDRFRSQTIDVWMSLPLHAQRRFLRHLRPYWDAHRHRVAPHVHTWVSALRDAGVLELHAGRITSARHADGRFDVAYRPRRQSGEHCLRVSHIVNCTGASADMQRAPDPLIQQILRDRLARAHATGLGLDVEPSGRLIGEAAAADQRIFALGPLAQGAFWETTAVPEIRANAAAMAQALLVIAKRSSAPHGVRTSRPASAARTGIRRTSDDALGPSA